MIGFAGERSNGWRQRQLQTIAPSLLRIGADRERANSLLLVSSGDYDDGAGGVFEEAVRDAADQ